MTTDEYLAWRESATGAHRARYRHAPRSSATPASIRSLAQRQSIQHYAAALLRGGDATERLFGQRGRTLLLKDYLVPGRWRARADAMFIPDAGTDASVVRIRAHEPNRELGGPASPSEADLFALAFWRYTVRAAGTPATRCILLAVDPDHRSGPGTPPLEEVLECHDLTRLIDEVTGPNARSIAEVVAEEAPRAADFLRDGEAVRHPGQLPSYPPHSLEEALAPRSREAVGRMLERTAND